MKFQLRLYEYILMLHPSGFRDEFAAEMARDFEDARLIYSVAELYRDACLSVVRQWAIRSVREAIERRVLPNPSLLAGQYVVVMQGGLTLFDLLCGMTLSVLLFTVFGSVYLR